VVAVISEDQWTVARAAVQDAGNRFADLVEASDPAAMATRDWSVADSAAHVALVALMDTVLTDPAKPAFPPPWNEIAGMVPGASVDTVREFNVRTLAGFTERNPKALADRVREHVDTVLRLTADASPEDTVDWLGGASLPLGGLLAHLVNELEVHGWDIARAGRKPWATPTAHAAQFLDLFFIGVLRHGVGRLFDGGPEGAGPVAVEFRSRHTTPVVVELRDGQVAVRDPEGTPDVRIKFDPVVLNLMLFGRVSKVRAAATGKVVLSGKRPWLLPVFLRTVRLPS
jgi:hypothetical protein